VPSTLTKAQTFTYRFLLVRSEGPPIYLQSSRAASDVAAVRKALQAAKNEAARHGLEPDARIIIERKDGTSAGEFSYAELIAHDPRRAL
jgi:dihydropteroate synthase